MPRSVYRQSAGNPIQTSMLPAEPLELEFAYRRGVDNTDDAYTWRVMKELTIASFVGLVACWLQLFVFDVGLLLMLGVAIALYLFLRAASSHFHAIRDLGLGMVLAAWIYHLFMPPIAIELFVALIASAFVAREISRHYAFVSTVAPMPLAKAWDIRDSVCWTTLASSLLLVPIALAALIPHAMPVLLAASVFGWIVMASLFVANPHAYFTGFCGAVKTWCSYNRDEHQLAGILSSPSGNCRRRLTLLVVALLLNVFAFFRVTVLSQAAEGAAQVGRLAGSVGPLEFIVNLAAVSLLFAALAIIPVLMLMLSVAIVGTPVFARLSIPKPSFVPAHEWKEITDRIRRSNNLVERNSLYLGRVSFDQSPMLVPHDVFREHAHFLGDSGSGKTARGLAPFIEQVLGSGNASVMVLDLKGDSPELLQTLRKGAETAKELTGNEVPVRYFTLREELATYGFNPFKLACWDKLNDLQKTDILCGALGLNYGTDYGEGYFSSANASVLYATVSHFPDIKNFEQLRDRIAFVISRPKSHGLDDKSRDAGNHVRMSVTRLAAIASLNISDECTPNAEVLRHNIDPTRLFASAEAHYFSLSTTLGPGSSPEIARLATYMLLTAATMTDRSVPVYLVIDEFQRMASRNLDYLLQLARSMGVAVILANQSMQDLKRYDLISTLETNCRYRQWFAISGWDDQDRLSQASGETIDTLDSVSVTHSTSDRGASTSTNHSSREVVSPRLTKNDVKLVSDDDRKSIVLINRGSGYAQYGGMPVVIESDFHISQAEYGNRKSAPWPSDDTGTFVPSTWNRPTPTIPHRGRRANTTPTVTQETISIEPTKTATAGVPVAETPATKGPQAAKPRRKKSRAAKRRKKQEQPQVSVEPTTQTENLFDRYLQENPIEIESDAPSAGASR